MTDPIVFDSTTPRFALPLLYAGQAQKEVFVNEALRLTDALLHCTVAGTAAVPPTDPTEGDAWLVSAEASGEWMGNEDAIALFLGGDWLLLTPRAGMSVYDVAAAQHRFFSGGWRKATLPVEPVGGSIVDAEARAVIADLVSALQALGIFPPA